MAKKMKVLLPQPIEAEAVGVLEANDVELIRAGEPQGRRSWVRS